MRPLNLKILVVDDHALMRESVRAILETDDGFEVVGEAESAAAAVERAGALRPDVVLLDLRLPDADGFTCLDALRRLLPDSAVIVFSAVDDPELVSAALDRGAAGYILKRIGPVDLPAAIRGTVDGSVVHVHRLAGPPNGAGLSPKEHDVLAQLAQGLIEPRDRQRAVDQRPDGEVPSAQRLPQARRLHADGGDPDRARAGARPRRLISPAPSSSSAMESPGWESSHVRAKNVSSTIA